MHWPAISACFALCIHETGLDNRIGHDRDYRVDLIIGIIKTGNALQISRGNFLTCDCAIGNRCGQARQVLFLDIDGDFSGRVWCVICRYQWRENDCCGE